MRIEPTYDHEADKQRRKERTERITRKIAIALAFVSVFFFYIKLVFL